MKFLIAFAALALVPLLSGCGTPTQSLYTTQQAYNLAERSINQLHAAGVVTVEEKMAIKPSRDVVAAALAAGWNALAQGDSSAADVYSRAAMSGLGKLGTFLAAKQAMSRPAH